MVSLILCRFKATQQFSQNILWSLRAISKSPVGFVKTENVVFPHILKDLLHFYLKYKASPLSFQDFKMFKIILTLILSYL